MPAPETADEGAAAPPSLTADVDPGTFRAVMATVCTPVSVVTAMAGDRPHGSTVSAFASLSLCPPMVLVSLDVASDLLRHLRASGAFGLNILHDGQAALAAAFARKGDDKFDGVSWVLQAGVPRLDGCAGWLGCTVDRLVDGGDHVVAFGRVIDAGHAAASPLTYHQRQFGTHQALPDDAAAAGPPLPANVRYLRPASDGSGAGGSRGGAGMVEEWFAFN
ncbi:MAG TPA: flavin reductase family protein [Trebonia sp.]|nr:flavin reductase family protein [Trebonia sp.]